MFKFFRQIWRGAGYLEGYGSHPGNGFLITMILTTGLAGAQRGGWSGFIGGAFAGAIGTGIPYIIGCLGRAKNYDQDQERTFKLLQKEYK